MSGARLAIIMLLLLPATVLGQTKQDEADKISNDRPDRPFQMTPASSEVKEAFDDFERFQKRGAWERALKSLYSLPEDQAPRFVDGRNGFIIPVARKRREVLAQIPPEGQVAYRLFYDDEAKKLLEQADGSSELKTLERIYSAYFLTSIGDNAADRLGDLYFEMGRFDQAADCWQAVLREHTDTDLSPALIAVKSALALSRAGRRAEIVTLRRDLADRYAGEKVSIGARKASVDEHLDRFLKNQEGTSKGTEVKEHSTSDTVKGSDPGSHFDLTGPSVWQMRFSESIVAGMTPPEHIQWESNPLSRAVPAVAVDGGALYANFLGYDFALNLQTGKLIWRSGSFHNLELSAQQDQTRMLDPARFSIIASKGHVWSLVRDLKDPNQMATFHLVCRRADKGDVLWQTTNLPDYALLDLVGTPILGGDTLFIVGKTPMNQQQQAPAHQYVLAVRSNDGKLLWKTDVGTFRQGQRYFYYGMRDTSPLPRLYYQAGSVFVDTHEGVLARLDAVSGELDWGYGYQTEPVESGNRFGFFRGMQSNDSTSSSVPLRAGEVLFVKGAKSERLYALDPDHMKVLWERPIAKSARLLGADEGALFLGGPEISAIDRKTKTLLWATCLPGGSTESQVLILPGGLWQLTPRGIFELDPKSGQVRRIFRGDDTGSDGGNLYLAGRLLLAVTNRTISAYPIAATVAERPGADPAATKTRASND